MEPQDSGARPTDVDPGFNNIEPHKIGPLPALTKVAPPPPNSRKKLLIVGLGLALLAAAGAGLFLTNRHKAPAAVALTKISVQLEWVNNPEFAGMYVAKDLGYYRDAGLDVNLKELQDSTDVNQEVASGKADYGVSTPLEIILGRDKGQKTKAIAAIYQTSAYSIVSPVTANIKTPSDFKGKILGMGGGNNQAKVTYLALIANAELMPSQTTLKSVDFDPIKVFNDKQADTFDAYRSDKPYLLNKANIPYNQIFPEDYGFRVYGDVLSASDTKIAQNPKQVLAFTKATLKGWQYVIDHQSETLAIITKHSAAAYEDPSYLKYDLTNTIPLIRPTGDQLLGSMQYVPWNRAYEAVKQAGMLKAGFNSTESYTNQFVK
jgi:ABC-type nitrate/sulfonate/bicarbonate transport system substrate-binding protein